jgi:hypothetical protein
MIHGMTTEAFLAAKMAERTRQGLKIVIATPEGGTQTVYPKDRPTKARWLLAYRRKGIVIVEE